MKTRNLPRARPVAVLVGVVLGMLPAGVAEAGSMSVGLAQHGLVERDGETLVDVRGTITEPGYLHVTALRRPFPVDLTDEASRAAWRERYSVGHAADSGAAPGRRSRLLVRLDRAYVSRHRGRPTTLYLHGGGEGAGGIRSGDVTIALELPQGTSVEERCGSVALAPRSDSVAFRIRATGVTCAFARALARRGPGPTGRSGEKQSYRYRDMRCRGRELPTMLPAVRWRCTRPGALVTFRQT